MRPLTKYQKILIETRAAFDARLPLPPRPLGPGGQAESKTERKARALARPWKWDDIKAELTEEVTALKADPSKIDDEHEYEGASPGEYRASVYLGSYVITPSSKVYMPWATGNLTPCPTCRGTGKRPPRNEIEELYVAEWKRLSDEEKMDWPGENTPAWSAYIQRRNAVVDANEDGTLDCNECDGCASHEAYADQVWSSEMSRLAEERDLVFDEEEGGYFVSLYFSIDENEAPADDNKPTMNYKGVA